MIQSRHVHAFLPFWCARADIFVAYLRRPVSALRNSAARSSAESVRDSAEGLRSSADRGGLYNRAEGIRINAVVLMRKALAMYSAEGVRIRAEGSVIRR